MHPAPSIVFFTSSAGAGYGLLFLLGLAAPAGLLPAERWFGAAALGLAFGLITAGLIASTFHLGHPERAWRAMSQWRSSWLSREGVAALLTYMPAGVFAIGWVFLETAEDVWGLLGLVSAVGAAITVYCTGMIYACLKTIRQWHHPLVTPLYLGFALVGGALWLNALVHLFGLDALWSDIVTLAALPVVWGVKLRYWRRIDSETGESTPETATGLGSIGKVRLLEPPHTEENYLLKEMGFTVARKHGEKLRRLALLSGLGGGLLFTLLAFLTTGWPAGLAALLAAAIGSAGILLERWLLFAQATHCVTLYYGAPSA